MEIIENEDFCIITPLTYKLDARETTKILAEINTHPNKKIGLDLSMVIDCTNDFINQLNNIRNLSVFNIPSNIFVLFCIMQFDKSLNLFASKIDFIEDKRRILNRKFTLINS